MKELHYIKKGRLLIIIKLTKSTITSLFTEVNTELKIRSQEAKTCVYGGTVMCCKLNCRDSTKDINALSKTQDTELFIKLSNLSVYAASANYLLAMKCCHAETQKEIKTCMI